MGDPKSGATGTPIGNPGECTVNGGVETFAGAATAGFSGIPGGGMGLRVAGEDPKGTDRVPS